MIGLLTAPARIALAGARWLAELNLAVIDADVARWYVEDGQLSDEPLNGSTAPAALRNARRGAVRLLEALGGHDPHPFDAPPTAAQRAAYVQPSAVVHRLAELERALEDLEDVTVPHKWATPAGVRLLERIVDRGTRDGGPAAWRRKLDEVRAYLEAGG